MNIRVFRVLLVFSHTSFLSSKYDGNNLHLYYMCRYREYTVMKIKHMRWRREKTKENLENPKKHQHTLVHNSY